MKPVSFRYFKPASVSEALALLSENQDDCKVLAGGQSLVPAMNFRLLRPSALIDINELKELSTVQAKDRSLSIGALTRHATFHRTVVAGPLGHLLTKVVRHIAHFPIRQRGTFGGSLAHADPAAEWCLVATTLGAEIVARSSRGERIIPSHDFFKGTFTTDLAADEILTEIRLPLLADDWRTGFNEFSRRAGDFALGMALAALRIEAGIVKEARLGIGGVSDRAIRLGQLERSLVGKPASSQTFDAIAQEARVAIVPTADIHASSEYRQDLIAAVVKRALTEAAA
ncbi:xanthine dehydrogenase family protein subunit M [Bradyrhizobium sp. dw_78]|uniref:FAD binding domain-containing protein n=1 Tax=Bradyrhizobium sp. dw_78 TaxID=2719793 RepID=UPI001BD32EFF|nr:xanthine dehydrogenase family protein subunit M [Bradyrhizobium sp. dw_78]